MDLIKKNSRQNYNALDLVKFICAILVFSVHVPLFDSEAGNALCRELDFFYVNYLCRIAVPFFFVSSGFFLFRKSDEDNVNIASIRKYCLRILRLYVIWSVIYLPLSLREIMQNTSGIREGILCFIRNCILTGSYIHLWYLNALIFGVLLTAILLWRKTAFHTILIISGILYVIGVCMQTWFGAIQPLGHVFPGVRDALIIAGKIFVTTRNGLCFAFFFVAIGAYLAMRGCRIPVKFCGLLFILSMLLNFAELFVLHKLDYIREPAMSFFLVPAAFFLFLWAVKTDLTDWKGYRVMRSLSSTCFYTHMWFYALTLKGLAIFGIGSIGIAAVWFLSLFATIIGSYVLNRLAQVSGFHWIRCLIQ